MLRLDTFAQRGAFALNYVTLIGANGLQAILAGVYTIVMSRLLGPADYGLMSAVLSSALLLAVLQGPLETGISRDAALLHGRGEQRLLGALLWRALRRLCWPLLSSIAFLCVIAGALSQWLHFDSPVIVIVMVWFSGVSLVLSLARGVLRGGHYFGAFATSQILESGARLVIGSGLIMIGGRAASAVSGYLAGAILAAAVALWQLHTKSDLDGASRTLDGLTLTKLSSLFSFYFYLTLVMTVDVVAARRFLDPVEAGYYAAAATLARMLWLAGVPACQLILVRAASLEAAGHNGLRHTKRAIAVLALILGLTCLIPYGAGPSLMRVILGRSFVAGAQPLSILWVATVITVLQAALTFSELGSNSVRMPWLFIGPCVLLFCLLFFFHGSGVQIAYSALAASISAAGISAMTLVAPRPVTIAATIRN